MLTSYGPETTGPPTSSPSGKRMQSPVALVGGKALSEEGARDRWINLAVPTVRARRSSQSVLIGACLEIMTRYNAEYAIPMPGNHDDLARPVLTSSLVSEAIDVPAMRASSVDPMIRIPTIKNTEASAKRADTRRRALRASYWQSGMDLLKRRAFRHIAGFGWTSLVVMPDDYARQGPFARICLRNPLGTYASAQAPEDLDFPSDVGFVHQMSGPALRAIYPNVRQENGGPIGPVDNEAANNEMWDILEWIDADYCIVGLLGKTRAQGSPWREAAGNGIMLRWYPNRLSFVPAFTPQVITLDKLVSRLTHMIGKQDMMAYLFELDIEMAERAVAPDRYALAGDGETPIVASHGGMWQSGVTGEINLLKGVRQVGELRGQPDAMNLQRIKMLESNARTETGIYGPTAGDSSGMAGSLRTGRGIDSMMANASDPRVAELQDVWAKGLTLINEAVFATYERCYPRRKFTMFSGLGNDAELVNFDASDLESHYNVVHYPLPGTDAYSMTVGLGQLVQADLISRQTARELHPYIGDMAEQEEDKIALERIEMLTWQAVGQRAAQGGLPPVDAAALMAAIRKGDNLETALVAVDRAAQERQASQAPPPGAAGAAPEAQPGLANPGEGAEMQPPPGPPGAGQPGGPQINPAQFLQALAAQGGQGSPAAGAPPATAAPAPTGAPM